MTTIAFYRNLIKDQFKRPTLVKLSKEIPLPPEQDLPLQAAISFVAAMLAEQKYATVVTRAIIKEMMDKDAGNPFAGCDITSSYKLILAVLYNKDNGKDGKTAILTVETVGHGRTATTARLSKKFLDSTGITQYIPLLRKQLADCRALVAPKASKNTNAKPKKPAYKYNPQPQETPTMAPSQPIAAPTVALITEPIAVPTLVTEVAPEPTTVALSEAEQQLESLFGNVYKMAPKHANNPAGRIISMTTQLAKKHNLDQQTCQTYAEDVWLKGYLAMNPFATEEGVIAHLQEVMCDWELTTSRLSLIQQAVNKPQYHLRLAYSQK